MADEIEIPNELLIEILARMPVKALIKFTCVCKYWLSLIRSPEFAAKQYATRIMSLSNQSNRLDYDCHFFMTNTEQWCTPVGEISLFSYETLDLATHFECKPVDPLLEFGRGHVLTIHGPCNGIFCVRMTKAKLSNVIVLWNPSTREVFKPVQLTCDLSQFFGFGFDTNTNDYKIVAFYCYNRRGPHRIQLYSLAANSWRDIEDSPLTFGNWKCLIDNVNPSSHGRMCNWLGFDSRLDKVVDNKPAIVYFLLSFDMVDEVFIETPVPDGIVESIRQCSFLQQRSHLSHPALVTYGLDDSCEKVTYVNVWILHEYGAAAYWTKQLSVMLPDDIIVAQPRGFWKDEEMLFMNDHSERVLTCYNGITQKLKTVDSVQLDVYQQLVGYVESLFHIQSLSQPRGEHEDSDQGPDYCLCEVNQPLCANSCIF